MSFFRKYLSSFVICFRWEIVEREDYRRTTSEDYRFGGCMLWFKISLINQLWERIKEGRGGFYSFQLLGITYLHILYYFIITEMTANV